MRKAARRAAFGGDQVGTPRTDNPGLAFERCHDAQEDKARDHDPRRKLFEALAEAGASEAYRAAYRRWEEATSSRRLEAGTSSMVAFEATTVSRLVVGLGAPSPHENGLSLNRTYGTPVVPGSTVKGALRDAAADLLGLERDAPGTDTKKLQHDLDPRWTREKAREVHGAKVETLLDVFGSVEGMAAVNVLDAWWKPDGASPFALDTITTHHPQYYTGDDESSLPLETEAPTPVAYLCVRQGATFRFVLDLPDPSWRGPLLKLVERAFARGLGAKVAQGYGRFRIVGGASS